MLPVLCTIGDQHLASPETIKSPRAGLQSFWVIVGFTFWFGFYLGAVIMHAATK